MVSSGYTRHFIYGLSLLTIALTAGCSDGLLSEARNNCSENKNQELIGSYKGKVKATLWESDAHEVEKNSCLWNVTLEINGTNADSTARSCDLRIFKLESKLIEQVNIDGGDHTCVDILDESQQVVQYDDYNEWENMDSDLPLVDAYGFSIYFTHKVAENSTAREAFHPYTVDTGKYITPVTGSYSTFQREGFDDTNTTYRFQKEVDGSMSFIDWDSYLKDAYYSVPEVTLSGTLLKQ